MKKPDLDIKGFVPGAHEHTVRPTSPYEAFGAQPAEVELTDDDIRKFDLFTEDEIASFMHWEMEMIRQSDYEQLKATVAKIRQKQKK
jgi:hypothetical protein